jgi:hypothetical protein
MVNKQLKSKENLSFAVRTEMHKKPRLVPSTIEQQIYVRTPIPQTSTQVSPPSLGYKCREGSEEFQPYGRKPRNREKEPAMIDFFTLKT